MRCRITATLVVSSIAVLAAPSPAQADCGVPRRVEITQGSMIVANARYTGTPASDPRVSTYDIEVTNLSGGWYYLKTAYPWENGGACWPYQWSDGHYTSPPGLPLTEFLAPRQTRIFRDVQLRDQDRFAFCYVGLGNETGGFGPENAFVLLATAVDLVALSFLGESIGTDFATGNPDQSLGGLIFAIVDGLSGTIDDALIPVSSFLHLAATGGSISELADAAYQIVLSLGPVKALIVDELRRRGFTRIFFWADRLLRAARFIPNMARAAAQTIDAGYAYQVDPFGPLGFEVVPAMPHDNASPTGYIVSPAENAVVGNTVNISGIASDECGEVQYVNLTYTTDNWATWNFAGRDTSAPYTFVVDLSAVPDGTTVRFGWDVYDTALNFSNSPLGNRTVIKNQAALAPPADDAVFVADVTYPDGSVLAPGQTFTKIFRIRNSGTSSYGSGYRLEYVSGTNLAAVTLVSLPALTPGQTGDISVPMTAPGSPGEYVSYWRLKNAAGAEFGVSMWAMIEVRCETPGCGTCDPSDRCLSMGCSAHNLPTDGARFKTPATGPGVYRARGAYKHAYPSESCYFLFHDSWSGLQCTANESAAELNDAPAPCRDGSFVKEDGDSTIYRLEGGRLRPLCGSWTGAMFFAQFGHTFDVALVADSAHMPLIRATYPLGAAIYPPGARAPRCGDPGFECGTYADPDLECYAGFSCSCASGADCVANRCVASTPVQALIPGRIIAPADGDEVSNQGFEVDWIEGSATDGAFTQTALYCRTEGSDWELSAGFGYSPPYQHPGAALGLMLTCKLRTRLGSNFSEYVDSDEVTWSGSTARAQMTVTAATIERDPDATGCEQLLVLGSIRNDGNQSGTWRARAFYHSSGASPESAGSIESLWSFAVTLDPGAETTRSFPINLVAPLPIHPGLAEVTVIADDVYDALGGATASMTAAAFAADAEFPEITYLNIRGFGGSPPGVMSGRPHTITVGLADDHALDAWELAWRATGGDWEPIIAESISGGSSCSASAWRDTAWVVPSLAAGTPIEVRARASDTAGNWTESFHLVQIVPDSDPAVTFFAPSGGERWVQHFARDPQCAPVEILFSPGSTPVFEVTVGFSNADGSRRRASEWLYSQHLPPSGLISLCLPTDETGDDLRIFVLVEDTLGRTSLFLSAPVAVEFPAPDAPWQPIFVEASQRGLPAPPFEGGDSDLDFLGLDLQWPTLSLFRLDRRTWLDPYASGRMDEFSIASLAVDLVNQTAASTPLLAAHTEPRQDDNEPRPARYDDWIRQYRIVQVTPGDCSDLSVVCDYRAEIRELQSGALTPWTAVGTYFSRRYAEDPTLQSAVVGPTGRKLLFVRDYRSGIYNRTDVYAQAGGAWSLLTSYPHELTEAAVVAGAIWILYAVTDPSTGARVVHAAEVSESTGNILRDQILMSSTIPEFYWQAAATVEHDRFHVVGFDGTSVISASLSGSTWTAYSGVALPSTWRGRPISSVAMQSVTSGGNYVLFKLEFTADRRRSIIVPFIPGGPLALDQGLEEIDHRDFSPRRLVVAAGGRMARVVRCRWNLEDRLCLQFSNLVGGSCYDGDACTRDSWQASADACIAAPVLCAGDGDACNGEEMCDPATGACISDSTTAPACDDGLACNGTESCDPPTGACLAGIAPAIDDGVECTIDACDEALGSVTHTPSADACLGDACVAARCAPEDASSDPTTGCVFDVLPVPSDSEPCTDDLCDPVFGVIHPIVASSCLVDGACISAGAMNPANACESCAPAIRRNGWSPANEGATCDDGQFCTLADICVGGACTGRVRDCAAELGNDPACGTASCDENGASCRWTSAPDGTACDDLDLCDGQETCAGGICVAGTPRTDGECAGSGCPGGICEAQFVSIAFGRNFGCGVRRDHTLWCFGLNEDGQLGIGTRTSQNHPVQVGSATDWISVSAGQRHACGLREGGNLFCWGFNGNGQIGDGTTSRRVSPAAVAPGIVWTEISAGGGHTCGIRADASMHCWGLNQYGQLGDGTTNLRTSPRLVPGGAAWARVTAGGQHSCAVRTDGTAWCFGYNHDGELGDGTTTLRLSPAQLPGSDWRVVDAGGLHTCGVRTDGRAHCWGLNTSGQLGDNTFARRLSPVQIAGSDWSSITTGGAHSCGIKQDGSVLCWGDNGFGQLGDGSVAAKRVPTPVPNMTSAAVVAGESNTCSIGQEDGLFCWGSNAFGSLGTGLVADRLTPVETSLADDQWRQASIWRRHGCGIRGDGTLKCWGMNDYGQLGLGNTLNQQEPASVGAASDWVSISAGMDHACGIRADRSLWCWGFNAWGRLGDGTLISKSSPVHIAPGSQWSIVSAGMSSTCGLKLDGTIHCWGRNDFGQLGDGTHTARYSPQQVGTDTDWVEITMGHYHVCAIRSGGQLFCWGGNDFGQLGDGTWTARTRPVAAGVGQAWVQVRGGIQHSCAIRADGSAWCWGRNDFGQNGDGTRIDRRTPVAVADGATWSSLAAREHQTCGIQSNGGRYCWGNNSVGQLGDGGFTNKSRPALIDPPGTGGTVAVGTEVVCASSGAGRLRCSGRNSNGLLGNGSAWRSSAIELCGANPGFCSVP